jgi:hypothetical protein
VILIGNSHALAIPPVMAAITAGITTSSPSSTPASSSAPAAKRP